MTTESTGRPTDVLPGDAPLARFLPTCDEYRSLHHLMIDPSERLRTEQDLDARAQRRFAFRCGNCMRAHQARVWDIATQRRCGCGVLMILPAPAPRPGTYDGIPSLAGLFCPRCGLRHPRADVTRRQATYCRNCEVWF